MGLYLLIPLSVLLVFIIGVIFWWSVRSGQYDDMEGPAHRLLLEDRDEPEAGPAAGPTRKPGDVESTDVENRGNSSRGADTESER